MAATARFDREVDLVVVGYGAAGAAAAITAADLGASVLVVEKQDRHMHTPNVRMSGGVLMAVNDVAGASAYLARCAGSQTPLAITAAWAARAAGLQDWLAAVCPRLRPVRVGGGEQPGIPGAESVDVLQQDSASGWAGPDIVEPTGARPGMGVQLFAELERAVERRALITVLHGHPACQLISESGTVIGVETESAGLRHRFRAASGVILCCGGFEFDDEVKRRHLPAEPTYFYGNPGNTGDGIRLATSVGAALWHMDHVVGRAIGWLETDDGPLGFLIRIAPGGYVLTDRRGRRFIDEHRQAQLHHDVYYELARPDPMTGERERIPTYWFFDERRRLAGPLSSPSIGVGVVGRYRWSVDMQAELERGWVVAGSSPEDAALAIGMDPPDAVTAAESVAAYNRGCAAGSDPFGRPAETLVPLDHPPIYCMALWPGGSNTSGGPRRDEAGRVLDRQLRPIRGLFAAGELGQSAGALYPAAGANLSEAFCFGQIAAETALDASADLSRE